MQTKHTGWLTTWKDIYNYCGFKDERLLKKYCADGLPVHKKGKVVVALPAELDMWVVENMPLWKKKK